MHSRLSQAYCINWFNCSRLDCVIMEPEDPAIRLMNDPSLAHLDPVFKHLYIEICSLIWRFNHKIKDLTLRIARVESRTHRLDRIDDTLKNIANRFVRCDELGLEGRLSGVQIRLRNIEPQMAVLLALLAVEPQPSPKPSSSRKRPSTSELASGIFIPDQDL